MAERGLRVPSIRLVRDGQTVPPQSYTKTQRLQSTSISDFIDAGRVYEHFAGGATIVLQALHRYWEPLAHFTRDLEIALTHPVQVNVYLTPPRARGLDVHYDTHDVFVMQVSGAKLWRVYGPAVDLPLAHQRRKGKFLDPGQPRIEVELEPGDSLYIPRGFLHAAETAASESTHMTVGVLTYRWMDVMESVMKRASEELFMRAALPPGFAHSPEELEHEVDDRVSEFATWLQSLDKNEIAQSLAERFWRSRSPLLVGQLQQLLSLDSVVDDSIVRRRQGATCLLKVEGDEVSVILGDRRVVMPARLYPALQQIAESSEFKVAELDQHLDAHGRLVLVRRLIREGLLEQALDG